METIAAQEKKMLLLNYENIEMPHIFFVIFIRIISFHPYLWFAVGHHF